MKSIVYILLTLVSQDLFSQLKLIKDINSGNSGSFSYKNSLVANNKIYFIADDGTNGYEVWSSDATLNGTKIIKDIYKGKVSCDPSGFSFSGNFLYFIANDSLHGKELWRTDDTDIGTQLVFDSQNGITNGSIYIPFNQNEAFAAADSKIYFLDNTQGLFESNGSQPGTKQIYPIGISYYLMSHQNKVYFVGRKSFSDSIYVYNPITKISKSINYDTRKPRDLISTPLGVLYTDNDKLFKIDSATSLPVQLSSTSWDLGSINIKSAAGFHKGYYYFTAYDRNAGTITNLYRTNGTKAGTEVFLNIGKDNFSSYGRFCSTGKYLFFLFNSGSGNPTELWRTDGTVLESIKLEDYNESSLNFITPSNNIIEHNEQVYYFQTKGKEISLYQSDGSVNGTKAIALINDASTSTQLTTGPLKLGNQLLFSANVKGSFIGEELWTYALPVGNSEITNKEINIYPNPTSGNLYLNVNDQSIKFIIIMDINGRPLEVKSHTVNRIDLTEYNSGFYFIHLTTDKISTVIKVLKQ